MLAPPMRRTFFGLGGLVVALGLSLAAPATAQDAQATFAEAVDLYERGMPEEGLAKLREVVAAEPDAETAYAIRDSAGYDFWASVLIRGGEHETAATELLRLARVEAKERRRDQDAIKSLLQQIETGDFAARKQAIYELGTEHGAFAVPLCQGVLSDPNAEDRRINVVYALSRMGSDVVLPLIELLDSDDATLDCTVAMILGNHADARAIPVLERELAAASSDALANCLRRALVDCGGSPGGSAADAYLEMARAYYFNDASVVGDAAFRGVFWKWDGSMVVGHEAPSYLIPLLLAEEACSDALALRPGDVTIQAGLARTLAKQVLAIETAGDSSPGAANWMSRAKALAAATGPVVLNSARRGALADNETEVANELSMLLAQVETAQEFTIDSSLVESLKSEDPSVRGVAAVAIAMIDPGADYPNKDEVVPALLTVVSETGQRQVLVIDDRPATRNELVRGLRAANLFVTWAESGLAGLERAVVSPTVDLFIVRSDLGGIASERVVNDLNRDFRTADTPIVILSPPARATGDQDLFAGKAEGFIAQPLDASTYVDAVMAAMGEDANPFRQRALQLAEIAAKELYRLADPGSGYTFPADADASLLRSLRNPDGVKVPAIRTLGRLGATSASETLIAMSQDPEQSPEVRAAACASIGEIGHAAGTLSDPALMALTAALGDASEVVRNGAAAGLASAPLTEAQRAAVYNAQRLNIANFSGGGDGEDDMGGEDDMDDDDGMGL